MNKDITKKKLGLFGGRGNVSNGGTGGGTTTGTTEGDRRAGIPSSIAERLRNKRDNQK